MTQSLDQLPQGATGVVATIDGGYGIRARLIAMGFTPGAEVTVMHNRGRGNIIVLVRDVRVALGRGQARKIVIGEK